MSRRIHRHADRSLAQPSCFPAIPFQYRRLRERRGASEIRKTVCGLEFTIHPGVYDTGVDTELMVDSVRLSASEDFLEIGAGCGAAAIHFALRARRGVGVDINRAAVANAMANQALHHVSNVEFYVGNLFEGLSGKFDVIVCNPPYNNHGATDEVDAMFWDGGDEMKLQFFRQAGLFLKPSGRLYFGWADFADLDPLLPMRLAQKYGFRYISHFERPSGKGIHLFRVFQFGRET